MNTKKVLKKLEEIGGFENVTLEGKNKVIATYTGYMKSINDQKLKEITNKFNAERYDYEIKVQEGNLILEIKDNPAFERLHSISSFNGYRVFSDPAFSRSARAGRF
ncbi:hypothetical protein IQN75_00700 [Elizabethkingia anophelis]|uniref:hypothetical protein n=1 Tax=Elizabethkingia anophelis TaxID=1117645 RepID=UPI0018802235|nr:hypothetical protein [Elizabethkingia anophelis]MBE9391932.1 hypothetical protein [Elizabethkingia anophelis]MBE9405372.1 hypothetical protein [Elizabethkingia anophelis]